MFENLDDMKREIEEKLAKWKGVVRFGTGEFADSLHAEEQTGISVTVAQLLDRYPQVVVEFKTKSAVTAPLEKIKRPGKVIIGYSLNTPKMIEIMEQGTATLEERLAAAGRCLEMGFNVAFHFDPIFWYDGWEQEYREVVDAIYRVVGDTSKVAWCSLGGFRSSSTLKTYLRERQEHLPLFSGEMITGTDRKLRYFRPVRVAIYRAMKDAFYRHHPKAPLYLCMESREVWEESGLLHRIPHGLPAYLDEQARAIFARVSSE
jgi:spore photoproduct lyase